MDWTQEQLSALEAAIAIGATEVQYQDKRVKYRSLAEMMQLRDQMRVSLGKVSSGNKRTYFKTSKGS